MRVVCAPEAVMKQFYGPSIPQPLRDYVLRINPSSHDRQALVRKVFHAGITAETCRKSVTWVTHSPAPSLVRGKGAPSAVSSSERPEHLAKSLRIHAWRPAMD